jgi:hypothetical protein
MLRQGDEARAQCEQASWRLTLSSSPLAKHDKRGLRLQKRKEMDERLKDLERDLKWMASEYEKEELTGNASGAGGALARGTEKPTAISGPCSLIC